VTGGRANRRRLVAEIRDAQRGLVRFEHAVHLVGQPRVVPELERGPDVARHRLQAGLEPGHVAAEVRRQLEQERRQVRTQHARGLDEDGH
jgi:hypothetical protein